MIVLMFISKNIWSKNVCNFLLRERTVTLLIIFYEFPLIKESTFNVNQKRIACRLQATIVIHYGSLFESPKAQKNTFTAVSCTLC